MGQSSQGYHNHIHHLVYKSGRQRSSGSVAEVTSKGQTVETFHYECSYLTCPATVSLRVVSPLLGERWVQLLTDEELLGQRADEAIALHPERLEGIARPQPINVLLNLRTYITNALHDSQQSKMISGINKRFMTCFGVEGVPCKDMLEFVGFTLKVRLHQSGMAEFKLIYVTRRMAFGNHLVPTRGPNFPIAILLRSSSTTLYTNLLSL